MGGGGGGGGGEGGEEEQGDKTRGDVKWSKKLTSVIEKGTMRVRRRRKRRPRDQKEDQA